LELLQLLNGLLKFLVKVNKMKIPLIFLNRETVALYFALSAAFRHLYLGFKGLFACIILSIFLIPLTLLDAALEIFSKLSKNKRRDI
jgi:hypothetical protein